MDLLDYLFWRKTIFDADHCLRVPESHGFKCFGPQVVKAAGFDSFLQEATAQDPIPNLIIRKYVFM